MARATNDKPASRMANGTEKTTPKPPPAAQEKRNAEPDVAVPLDELGNAPTVSEADRTTLRGQAARGTGKWWLAVVVGLITSAPFVWLLSYGAALPYYLGLFFFVLFGLVIGAAMHRVASPDRPYGRGPLLVGTTLVVMAGWCGAIVIEARGFPHDMADEATNMARRTIADVETFRATVTDDVRRYLRETYPPGGAFGYVRWILTSGELPKGGVKEFHRTYYAPQRKISWAVRIVLSLALYAFGIGSQTLLLQSATERTHRMIDEEAIA